MNKILLLITIFISLAICANGDDCPYFGPNTCLKEAKDALNMRLSSLQGKDFQVGNPVIFCGALDDADSETVLYKYRFLQIKGPKTLKLKAEVEITLNMDECVNPIVTILN